MNSKAFTLIEVLVSITILAVVATGLFKISLNSKANFAYLYKKSQFDRLSSIAFMHNDQKFHHKEKSLYDFVRDNYTIKDDEIRQYLKKNKISYSQEEYSTLSLGDNSDTENTNETNSQDQEGDIIPNITFVFDKITISNKNQSTYAYKIYMRE